VTGLRFVLPTIILIVYSLLRVAAMLLGMAPWSPTVIVPILSSIVSVAMLVWANRYLRA
jgi:hypothetical protein